MGDVGDPSLPVGEKEVNDFEAVKRASAISRRMLLTSLGAAGAALMVGGKVTLAVKEEAKKPKVVPSSTTLTPNLKLKKTAPLDEPDVNANFDRIDAEFAGRAVTPDFYKSGTGLDDTAAVQAAFDSGKPVIFTRDYYVKSVRMFGVDQKIDFNGYWLWGIAESTNTSAERDCVLEIAGLYMQLFNVKVVSDFNMNYKCGVHWRSESNTRPAEHIKIYGLQINRLLIGLQCCLLLRPCL